MWRSTFEGELVSKPYVAMTRRSCKAFGARSDAERDFAGFRYRTRSQYSAREYAIEPDASAASYFWAAAAHHRRRSHRRRPQPRSLQGDVAFVECLAQMGCGVEYCGRRHHRRRPAAPRHRRRHERHQRHRQTLAAVALFAEGPTTIRNVAHIRHKETDRIAALATELPQVRRRRRRVRRRPDESPRPTARCVARAASHDRNLQRPPHGHEPGPHRPGRSWGQEFRSGLHGEDSTRDSFEDLERLIPLMA